jgi:hypothetical protein
MGRYDVGADDSQAVICSTEEASRGTFSQPSSFEGSAIVSKDFRMYWWTALRTVSKRAVEVGERHTSTRLEVNLMKSARAVKTDCELAILGATV